MPKSDGYRTEKDYIAVEILDVFTKTFCIKENSDNLEFECAQCQFCNPDDGACAVKMFKNVRCPEFKDFGSMGDL